MVLDLRSTSQDNVNNHGNRDMGEEWSIVSSDVDAVKASLQSQLDHTTVIEPDGTKRKLKPKD